MTLKELTDRTSLKSLGRSIGLDVRVVDGRLHISRLHPHPVDDRPLWAQRLSSKSSFCRAVVQSRLLTRHQMVHAAWRYRLGRSKDDAVIYWQIDQLGQLHDGKLMWYGPDCHRLKHRHATWAMYLLKQHYGVPQDTFQSSHCFFGLHLLTDNIVTQKSQKPQKFKSVSSGISVVNHNLSALSAVSACPKTVCVVEAEKSAVILSELYPQCIWLAAGGMFELQVQKFLPLRHHKIILFPDTDPDGRAFRVWYDVAQQVMRSFFWSPDNPIRVSPILELHATPDQKQRKIDLVDYLFEQ